MPDDNRTPVIRRSGSLFRGAPGSAAGARAGRPTPPDPPITTNPWVPRPPTRAQETKPQREAREKREKQAAEEEAEAKRAAEERQRISRARGRAARERVYVDGRLSTTYEIDVDGDGLLDEVETLDGYRQDGSEDPIGGVSLTPRQRRQQELDRGRRSATFSVLGIDDVDENLRFIMSNGPRLDKDGDPYVAPGGSDNASIRAKEHRSDAQGRAVNMMTIAGGVSRFRNLSRSDPQAYAQLVDLLVGAGYLNEQDARKSAYTREMGRAFAYAAADAAENADIGTGDDLITFLQKARGDVDAIKAAAGKAEEYQPVDRQFTDPTALALTARQAAEELLGRALSDEEAARFQAKFRGAENSRYDQIDAAGRAKTAASVVDPNPSGQADAFLRSGEFDEDRARKMAGDFTDSLTRLLMGE